MKNRVVMKNRLFWHQCLKIVLPNMFSSVWPVLSSFVIQFAVWFVSCISGFLHVDYLAFSLCTSYETYSKHVAVKCHGLKYGFGIPHLDFIVRKFLVFPTANFSSGFSGLC